MNERRKLLNDIFITLDLKTVLHNFIITRSNIKYDITKINDNEIDNIIIIFKDVILEKMDIDNLLDVHTFINKYNGKSIFELLLTIFPNIQQLTDYWLDKHLQ